MHFLKTIYEILDHYSQGGIGMRDGRLNTVVASFYNRPNQLGQSVSGSDCLDFKIC